VTAADLAERKPVSRAWSRAAEAPALVWLAGLVIVSTLVRSLIAFRYPAPWIFNDELNYSDLARSLGRTGHFAIRSSPGLHGFGPVYPTLIAPAYAVFDNVPHAYDAARVINSLLMSLAAVPAYFLARRLAGNWWSLFAAFLTVLIPSMTYSAAMMTENAFYPLVVTSVLAIVLALERPTVLRQVVQFVPILLAFETRTQAAIFAPALVTALVLVGIVDAGAAPPHSRLRALVDSGRRYWVTWAVLIAGAILAILYAVARGRPLNSLLGAQGGVTNFRYALGPLARWFFYHLGEIDVYVGIIPFAAFLLMTSIGLRPAEADRRLRIFSAVAVSVVSWFTFTAAAYASNPIGNRIEERYLFHIVPLFFVAFAAWLGRSLPRPWPAAAVAAVIAAAIPGVVPWPVLMDSNSVNGAFALLPLIRLVQRGLQPNSVAEVVSIAAIVGSVIYLVVPRRLAFLIPIVVVVYFLAIDRNVRNATVDASRGSIASGISVHRDWIDRVAGGHDVSILYYAVDQVPYWQNEFFNGDVNSVYNLTPGSYDALPQTLVQVRPTGVLASADGKRLDAHYVLTNQALVPDGQPVASDQGIGMTLYRTSSPVRLAAKVDGVYPDKWSGPTATYQRYNCRAGTLTAVMLSDRDLHPQPQTIVATEGTREIGRFVYKPGLVTRRMTVPVRPVGDTCTVNFNVPTAVPLDVTKQPDTRALGVRFLGFDYRPSR
jgi:hypothetical protein